MLWRPFAQTKVDDDVLTGDPRSRVDSPSMNLLYPGHMTPQTSLTHTPRRLPGELIEPTIHPLVKGIKPFFGLGTGLVGGGYDL
jgi:hypothetical protein